MTRTREWSLHDYWNRLLPSRGRFARDFAQAADFPSTDADVTDEMLAESYVTVARLVEVHGEQYLPLFERLHTEMQARKDQQDLLAKARSVARNAESDLI